MYKMFKITNSPTGYDMSKKVVKKSEFSRMCGISPAAVSAALKAGRLRANRDGNISLGSKLNKAFLELQEAKKNSRKTKRHERKLQKYMNGESIGDTLDLPPLEIEQDPFANAQSPDVTQYESPEEYYASEKLKADIALKRAKLAETVRAVVRRDFVDRVIGKIGGVIADHMITMGERLSPVIAGHAGSTDPSHVRRIRDEIDEDSRRTIDQIKRVIRDEYVTPMKEA